MSHTPHHNRKRWRPPHMRTWGFWMPHAPAWFRRLLTREHRRVADRELRRYGEVRTRKPKGADWEWW